MSDQYVRALKAPSGLGAGSQLAGYRLEEQIGQGGMAVVYRAHQERLGRMVALKVLAPALASDEGFRQRFIRESQAAAAVDDPHIIPVFEAGEADGALFIAMRLVRGGDVRSLITAHGSLPAERAMSIIAQAASALDAAHARGLVHRDVKPANMLLEQAADAGRPGDHVYLSDFGLSKTAMHSTGLTGTGTFLGTLDYVSPEQIEGKPVDGRADQYSLACAAYEMLSGAPPFTRDDAMALMYAQMYAAPPPLTSRRPELPAAVDEVFARALAKSPEDRYGNCSQFSDAVRQAFRDTAADPPTTESASPHRVPWPQAGAPGGPPPTDVVRVAADAAHVRPGPAPAGAGTGTAGTAPAGAPGPGGRRVPGQALLIGACILAAAGLVSWAIVFRLPGHAGPAPSGTPTRPGNTAGHGGQPSPQARRSSPIPGTKAQHSTRSHGYRLAARLNPGPLTVSISGVTWSPTGLVAASDQNGDTYIWTASTGAQHGPALAGPGQTLATAFSPDGSVLASGFSDGSTYLWDTATGKLLATMQDPGSPGKKEVDWLAFSPDGRTLATSDGNGYTNLWNVGSVNSGVTRTASLPDPAGGGVYSVAFSGNGRLATGDYYGHVYLWDVATDSTTATFSLPGGSCPDGSICDAVTGLAFNADGSVLAAASKNGNAELWSVGGQRASAIPTSGYGGPVIWGLSFSGSTLAAASADGHVNLWRVSQGSLTATPAGGVTDPGYGKLGIGSVTFGAAGKYLVAGDTNGSVYLWKLGQAGSAQSWTSARLVITPRSLGAVRIGMTTGQASAAAGQKLKPVGDGVWYRGGVTTSALSVLVSGDNTVSCVSAADRPGVPEVVTPQGFRLGGTLARLKAIYRGRIRYVPAPTGGIMPLPGYVVGFSGGNLVFWVRNGSTVDEIAGGPGVLPSTDCI